MDGRKLLLIILLLTAGMLFAEDVNNVLDKVENKYNSVKTFRSDFTQENYWEEIDIEKTSAGVMTYNDEKLLLNYSDPEGELLFVKSDSVFIYIPSAQQYIEKAIDTELETFRPYSVVQHYSGKSSRELTETTDTHYIIELKPEDDSIVLITAKINKKTYLIDEITYKDTENNFVTYKFENIKTNIKISDKDFQFNKPEIQQ